jgi:hypothetical protein
MATRKIRITLFWSDEAAAVQDFQARHTQKQVDWANAFFGRYAMELDVQPDPGGKVADAYPYCLVKSGGHDPDLASFDEVVERLQAARMQDFVARGRLLLQIDELKKQEREKGAQIAARLATLAVLPIGAPDRPAAEAQLQTLLAEYRAITQAAAATGPALEKIEQALERTYRAFLVELEEHEFRNVPRTQLGEKVLASVGYSGITKVRSPGENPLIHSDRRLKVLNARFRLSPRNLRMRAPGNSNFGVALQAIGFNRLNGKYLWDGRLIMINLLRFEQITLAHEIVHTSGRSHVHPKLRHKAVPSVLSQIRQDFATGGLIVPSMYEFEQLSSYRDGPDDDIINYNAKSRSPADVKLYPEDQTAMEEAFFVKEPAV